MRKGMMLIVVLFFMAIIASACGGSDEGEAPEEVAAEDDETVVEEDEEEEEEEIEEEQEEEEELVEDTASESDFADLIAFMEEETQGTATVLYENDNPQTHEMEGVTVTLEAYTLVELLDFHRDYSIPFDDQNNGAVVIAQYRIMNDTDQDVHYMTTFDMDYVGAEKYLGNHQYLLPEEVQLPNILAPSNEYLLEAGQEIVGYYAYPIGEDRLADIMELGSVDVQISTPRTDYDDYGSTIGSEGRFTLPLDPDSEAEEEERAAQGFYEDRVTADNMGEKTMLEQEENIGETKEIGDSTITLEGYQFTHFVPNEEEAPRFQDDEYVLLTVKFIIDNGHDEDVSKSSVSSTLYLNDGKLWTLNEGMLLLYSYSDVIPAGESGEILQVFLLDKEEYEKVWKDKSFEMEIGPLRNIDAEDLSKGERVEFKLK